MLTTMSSAAFELNSSYYTAIIDGSNTLERVSVLDPVNETASPYMLPTYIRVTSMVIVIVVMVLGIIGNLMVPLVVLRGKDMRNSTNIFLVNLSAADLCVLLVCAPTVLVEVNSGPQVWPLGEHMCKIVPFVELTVAHASVLTILAISFERYYAICEPLRAGYICTKTRATFLCFLAWVFAGVCASPILPITSYVQESKENNERFPSCNTSGTSTWAKTFFITTTMIFFVVPVLMLMILYTIIAQHLMANPAISRGPANNLLKYRKQVVVMLGTVVLCFFTCLLPFRAFTLWILIAPPSSIVSIGIEQFYSLLYFCRVMLYLNSAINPILYNLMSTKFREGFLRLWKLRRNRNKESTTSTRTKTTATTSSNNSSDWRRESSNKSCGNKVTHDAMKHFSLPILTTVSIGKKELESYV
ncbi:growth hormone secretagogue receptor type 1 isoform X2 [Diachasmimorpha longicaudata]|uniref:growth hormone secretagogue receptor type 1 isoform X2 n=1 Tax=Diachasmimorpha longicaudata TaxID=58733 RepID=UPI0030B8E132